MKAWHFLPEDKRLGYNDGRLVEVGVPLECEGEPALCENGMHGSTRLIDALHYASGPIVCRVEIEGDLIGGYDKLCGRRRTVLWWVDATRILHEFACLCAEDALSKVAQPDERSVEAVEAIDAKRTWLRGEITDGELDAVRAAWAAARAARNAAWAAAWSAAWAAVRPALDAADAADAASASAGAQQNARLTEMVMAAHGSAEGVRASGKEGGKQC